MISSPLLRKNLTCVFATAVAIIIAWAAVLPVRAEVSFTRTLREGDMGEDVRALQRFLNASADTRVSVSGPGSPGMESNYFGVLTRAAVIRFQNKYRSEVLTPAGLLYGTGIVGPLTRGKIASLTTAVSPVQTGNLDGGKAPVAKKWAPTVTGVNPSRVRAGEKVTIYGDNFTPSGNTVRIAYGLVERRFPNLTSADGKTISFIYVPPEPRTMSKEEILSLPPLLLTRILAPISAAGATLDDAMDPYRNLKNEVELDRELRRFNHSLDDLYDRFYVEVTNQQGMGRSATAVLSALRKLSFGGVSFLRVRSLSSLPKRVLDFFLPTTAAQEGTSETQPGFDNSEGANAATESQESNSYNTQDANQAGGGWFAGIIMYCTCGGGHLSFAYDILGAGTGIWFFPPGYVPTAGSGFVAGPWLGFFQQSAGSCSIYVGISCISIQGTIPTNPWGTPF